MSDDIKNNIFQVIKKLRLQKSRPDIIRISHRLEKLHGVPKERTQHELDRLVSELKLCRVDSKGNHSYRIVADSLPDGSSENSMSELLIMALNDLTAPELKGRKNQKQYVSLKELRKHIYKDNNPRNIRFLPQKSPVWSTILEKLCNRGTVQLLDNGKYSLTSFSPFSNNQLPQFTTSTSPKAEKEELYNSTTNPSSDAANSVSRDVNIKQEGIHDEDTPLSLVAGISDVTSNVTNDSDDEDSRPIALLALNTAAITPSTGLTPSALTPTTAPDTAKQETVAAGASVVCLSPSLPSDPLSSENEVIIQGSKSAINSMVTGSPECLQDQRGVVQPETNNEQQTIDNKSPLDKKTYPISKRGTKRKRNDLPQMSNEVVATSLKKLPSERVTRTASPSSSSAIKKFKATKDTKAKRTCRSMTSSPLENQSKVILQRQAVCDFCLLPAKGTSDVLDCLLSCSDCKANAHPSCMQYSQELANHAKLTNWQCIDCKVCCICLDAREVASMQGDEMLFCDSCDKGYHMNCHFPVVESKPKGNWQCSKCYENSKTKTTDYGNKFEVAYSHYPKFENQENMPNASLWQVEDVFRFLKEKGFEEQAFEFKKQEIDGPSLLLMKRQDVLNSLSLRLGPALKIYHHIECLQRVALHHYSSIPYNN